MSGIWDMWHKDLPGVFKVDRDKTAQGYHEEDNMEKRFLLMAVTVYFL